MAGSGHHARGVSQRLTKAGSLHDSVPTLAFGKIDAFALLHPVGHFDSWHPTPDSAGDRRAPCSQSPMLSPLLQGTGHSHDVVTGKVPNLTATTTSRR